MWGRIRNPLHNISKSVQKPTLQTSLGTVLGNLYQEFLETNIYPCDQNA
jgi:hypothetical protein